jgi:hypothetical protein
MSAREVQDPVGRLVEISRRIEECEAEVYRLRCEQRRLQAELGATGYQAGERTQEDLLP